jgi:hypothetical protein
MAKAETRAVSDIWSTSSAWRVTLQTLEVPEGSFTSARRKGPPFDEHFTTSRTEGITCGAPPRRLEPRALPAALIR